jgi:hypothetical protein
MNYFQHKIASHQLAEHNSCIRRFFRWISKIVPTLLIIAAVMMGLYFLYQFVAVLNLPTDQSILTDTIIKNYATCGHRVVYYHKGEPYVWYHGEVIYLEERGCR